MLPSRVRTRPCQTQSVTGTTLLQYLGLRRAPGTVRTAFDRVWTAAMVLAVSIALLLTKNLDLWSQIAVLAAVSLVLGVLGAATLAIIAARRARRDTGE